MKSTRSWPDACGQRVAPHAGGVDLKPDVADITMGIAPVAPPRGGRGLKSVGKSTLTSTLSRPPRGGRGLKSWLVWVPVCAAKVAPLAGGVD